ncbi:Argininosuccinate lyase [Alphaproteobacteria bacterium]
MVKRRADQNLEGVQRHRTWGGRFTKALHPKAALFNASIHFDCRLYEYDIIGSQAHAEMLAKQGLISEAEANQIIGGLEELKQLIATKQVKFDLLAEDIHMNIEKLLEERIGEAALKLHTGRSRNDQVALDLRLFLRDAIDSTVQQIENLNIVLSKLAEQYKDTILPGYTHLQKAQPITLASYLGAYKSMFLRDLKRLQNCREQMNYSPLGAGALAGSNLPLDRHFVASQLKFNGIIENTIDAVSDRDFVIEFCSVSSIIMLHLSRFCEDIIIWATSEFGFIELDDEFSTGSSLMPNKRNPDLAELIRGKSGRVFGHLVGLLTMMKGLPLAYNKDLQEDKEAIFDTVDTILACLEIFPLFLNSIKFNSIKMEQASKGGFTDAVFWVEQLVLKGIPFRKAHETVGKWVLEAIENNTDLENIALKNSIIAEVAQW